MNLEPERCKKAISKIWRRTRVGRQVSREYVANALSVSKSTIDKIEQGTYHVRFSDVIRFCVAIDFCPVEFMQLVKKELYPPPPRKRKIACGGILSCKHFD